MADKEYTTSSSEATMSTAAQPRPKIAFFDYPDVFEDFYPHYDVDQRAFATIWANSGNHAFIKLLQRDIGDVTWYALSLSPAVPDSHHAETGCRVSFLRSSWPHRLLWRAFYLPSFAWRWRSAYPVYATLASYLAPLSLALIQRVLSDKPDFVFVQDYSSGKFDVLSALAAWLRVPIIAYHSGSELHSYHGRLLRKWTLSRAHHVIASGWKEADLLTAEFRVAKQRVSVVLTPIDTSIYAPMKRTRAIQSMSLDPARRYVLFVGRLDDRVKRVSAIINVFASIAGGHHDVDLLIIGNGADRGVLETLADKRCPCRVKFLGWVPDARVKAYLYSASECLILASSREGFPTVVGEALACGTPIIATDVGAVSELVCDGETGWLIPPGDDAALAARLERMLSDPGASGDMRQKARTIAEARVSPKAVAEQLRACFAKAQLEQHH
jgi:glycosyltransferase involved in cell wall biosynthesis